MKFNFLRKKLQNKTFIEKAPKIVNENKFKLLEGEKKLNC